MVKAASDGITNVGNIIAAGSGRFAAAWRKGQQDEEAAMAGSMDRLTRIAEKGRSDIDKALMGGSQNRPAGTPANKAPGSGTQTYSKPDEALFKAQLALQHAMDQAALSLQLEYLREGQAIYDDAYKNNLITTKEYYDAKLAIETKALDLSIAEKQREAASLEKQANAPGVKESQRVQMAAQEQKVLGEINVLEAKRTDLVRSNAAAYALAEQQRQDALSTIRINAQRQTGQNELAMEAEGLAQRRALLQASAEEEIAQRADMERRAFENEKAALEARRGRRQAGRAGRADALAGAAAPAAHDPDRQRGRARAQQVCDRREQEHPQQLRGLPERPDVGHQAAQHRLSRPGHVDRDGNPARDRAQAVRQAIR
jgi:hypothetical protein